MVPFPWGFVDLDRTAWHVSYRRDALHHWYQWTNREKLTARQKKPSAWQRQKGQHQVDHRQRRRCFNSQFDGVIGWLERTLNEPPANAAASGAILHTHTCSSCEVSATPGAALSRSTASLPKATAFNVQEVRFFHRCRFNTIAGKNRRRAAPDGSFMFSLNVGLGISISIAPDRRYRAANHNAFASPAKSGEPPAFYVLDEPSIGLHQRDNAA